MFADGGLLKTVERSHVSDFCPDKLFSATLLIFSSSLVGGTKVESEKSKKRFNRSKQRKQSFSERISSLLTPLPPVKNSSPCIPVYLGNRNWIFLTGGNRGNRVFLKISFSVISVASCSRSVSVSITDHYSLFFPTRHSTLVTRPFFSSPPVQCWPPPPESSSVRSTASRLNEAGFWRGGNCLNPSICCATTACIPYIM